MLNQCCLLSHMTATDGPSGMFRRRVFVLSPNKPLLSSHASQPK
jgi:hypothetical protein